MKVKVGDLVVRKRIEIAKAVWENRWKDYGQDPYAPKKVVLIGLNGSHVSFDMGGDIIWWRAENFERPAPSKTLDDYL